MTPKELDTFIARQERMSARIAKKAARGRTMAKSYGHVLDSKGRSLGDRIEKAIGRPGVAPTSRPVSKDGGQTFHFAMTSINRTSDFRTKTAGAKAGLSAAHERYIEREGAAETIENDLTREVKLQDREGWLALGGQAYIERPAAAETSDHGRTLASFGNIAERFEDRMRYWEAAEEAASRPRSHGLVIDLSKDDRFWAVLAVDETAPAVLRKAWRSAMATRDAALKEADGASASGPEISCVTPDPSAAPSVDEVTEKAIRSSQAKGGGVRLTDKQAIEVHEYLRLRLTRSKVSKKTAACHIEPGRGGRVQNRLIIELPFEMTPEARLQLAKDFCHEKFVKGRDCPLPHWCVIHAPDHHNDPRNTHMHIVFSERPARLLTDPATGRNVWDFEIIETTTDKYWNKRSRRPFEQKTDRKVNHRSWVGEARRDYARLANVALKRAGIDKLYDPRRYEEMGIAVVPRARASVAAYLKEKQGISTAGAAKAIQTQWKREIERLEQAHPTIKPNPEVVSAFTREMKRWDKASQGAIVWSQLVHYRDMYREASVMRQYYAAEGAASAHILKRIHSKLIPPLATHGPPEALVTQFSKVWTKDLITDNRLHSEKHARREAKALRALERAQKLRVEDAGYFIDIGESGFFKGLATFNPSIVGGGRGEFSSVDTLAQVRQAYLNTRQQASIERADRKVTEKASIDAALAYEAKERVAWQRSPRIPCLGPTAPEERGNQEGPVNANSKPTPSSSRPEVTEAQASDRAKVALAEAAAAQQPTIQAFFGRTGPVIQRRAVPPVSRATAAAGHGPRSIQPKPERAPFVPTERVKVDVRMPKLVSTDYDFTAPREPLLASEIAAAEMAKKAMVPAANPRIDLDREKDATPLPSPKADTVMPRRLVAASHPAIIPHGRSGTVPGSPSGIDRAPSQPSASIPVAPNKPDRAVDGALGASHVARVIAVSKDETNVDRGTAHQPTQVSTPSCDGQEARPQPSMPTSAGPQPIEPPSLKLPAMKKKRELTREEIRRRVLMSRSRGRDFER